MLLLRFANDLEELAKVEQLPKLEGKKMFLYLAPKKAGVAKKSQQKRDREEAEAGAKAGAEGVSEEPKTDGGLFANAKNGADALKKLILTNARWVSPRYEGRHGQPVRNVLVYTLPQMNINNNFNNLEKCQSKKQTLEQKRDLASQVQVR